METTKRMDPIVKAKWVAALRSGAYGQGTGQLRDGNEYCCLGVLCDLRGPQDWVPSNYGNGFAYAYDPCADMPPGFMKEWAGLDWDNVLVEIDGRRDTLNEHNDNGRTFAEIADAIEEQL